jgi:YgiT-type zinc finger domain-containing protein
MDTTCFVCHEGTCGTTSYTFDRDDRLIVLKDVPAQVCGGCGEAWLDDLVAGAMLRLAAEADPSDGRMVRSYGAG